MAYEVIINNLPPYFAKKQPISCILGQSYPHFSGKVTPIFSLFPLSLLAPTRFMQLFYFIGGYVLSYLLFLGSVSIEQIPTLLLNTPSRRLTLTDYQLPMPKASSAYLDLTDDTNNLVRYFRLINLHNIQSVMEKCYSHAGPQGHGIGLFLSRILKIKQSFVSDRILARRLSENSTYRHLCLLDAGSTPAHNTYNTLRKHLGVENYAAVHINFVEEANELGLLNPNIKQLPQNRRDGLILIGDSTPIRSYCSSKGIKQDNGSWIFTDPSASFGRPHHKDKYPVGHKAHSLISITGIPMVSIVRAASFLPGTKGSTTKSAARAICAVASVARDGQSMMTIWASEPRACVSASSAVLAALTGNCERFSWSAARSSAHV